MPGDYLHRETAFRFWLTAGAIAGVVLLTYSPSFNHEFVDLDDHFYVVENDNVNRGLSLESVWWAFSGMRCSNYQPLTLLSHMLDCSLYGLNARGHHATSVLLHAMNTALVFILMQRLTSMYVASVATALLFGLHPLRVEAVAWIASRKDVLCGLFFLAALLAYGAYVRRHVVMGGLHGRLLYIWAVMFHGAALLAKPTAVTLPGVLLLLDAWPLCRGHKCPTETTVTTWRKLIVEKLPFFALSSFHALATLAAQRTALASLESVPISLRLENAVVFLSWQTWASFCPVGLAASYPYPKAGFSVEVLAGSVVGLAVLTWACIALRARLPMLLVGWLWFVGMLIPVLGLFQQGDQGVADRWTYLPGIGMAFALAFGGMHAFTWLSARVPPPMARVAGWAVLGCLAVALAAMSARQASYWRDAETLWRRSATCYPWGDKALTNLGWALHERGRDDEAMQYFAAGLAVNPRHADCANILGLLLGQRGLHTQAEACFRLAIEHRPGLAPAHGNLGVTLARLEKYKEAEREFSVALQINPSDPDVLFNHGVFLQNRGDAAAARARFMQVLSLSPGHAAARQRMSEVMVVTPDVKQ